MSFLLDTNICSEYLKRPGSLAHRFVQHGGQLAISSIALAELYTWAYRRKSPEELLSIIQNDLLVGLRVLNFDASCAKTFGRLRAELMSRGSSINGIDLLIGSIAVTHDQTMVTRNVKHFEPIPGLRVENWLSP